MCLLRSSAHRLSRLMASAIIPEYSPGKGDWKIAATVAKVGLKRAGRTTCLFCPWMLLIRNIKSGDILYKKREVYQANFSTRRMEITLCFAFRLRFRRPPHCFYKTIDAFSGCLYPQPRYIFPPALQEAPKQRSL
jgi:hypothetical protein